MCYALFPSKLENMESEAKNKSLAQNHTALMVEQDQNQDTQCKTFFSDRNQEYHKLHCGGFILSQFM